MLMIVSGPFKLIGTVEILNIKYVYYSKENIKNKNKVF
jgi:hypothetical protein